MELVLGIVLWFVFIAIVGGLVGAADGSRLQTDSDRSIRRDDPIDPIEPSDY